MSRKIAIVARAGTSALAPFRDESWEIWCLPWIHVPRATLLFEIHSQQCVDEEPVELYRNSEWLPDALAYYADVPVLCDPSRTHLFPKGEDFPLAEVKACLPLSYLENSIAYQLAYAFYEHKVLGRTIAEIGLYGVHMMGRLEFVWERPSVIYYIGLLQGAGINVHLAPGSPLFMSGYLEGRYGIGGGFRHPEIVAGFRVAA